LLRLGWSHKDKEIFSLKESIKYFNLSSVGKSPSKLDMDRILSMNEHYIKNMDEKELFQTFKNYCQQYNKKIESKFEKKLANSMHFLKNKAKSLEDIHNNANYITTDKFSINSEDLNLIDDNSKKIINDYCKKIEGSKILNRETLEKYLEELMNKHQTNFKGIGQPMRIALTGSKFGPGIYDIILSLEKDEVLKRLSRFN